MKHIDINELYDKELPGTMSFTEASAKLVQMKGDYVEDLRSIFCNRLLDAISIGYMNYKNVDFSKDKLVQLFIKNVALLPESHKYLYSVRAFFRKEHSKCLSLIKDYISEIYEDSKKEMDEDESLLLEFDIVVMFIDPFKEAFDGFWAELGKVLEKYPMNPGLIKLCNIMEQFYVCKTDDEIVDYLTEVIQNHPDLIVPKELIAYTYQNMKMWNNAIAYYESVGLDSLLFVPALQYFQLAWCYGKIKNRKAEEHYYRKALEVHPTGPNVLNNLGYCLYGQGKYEEAKKVFKQCLDESRDLDYAGTNYVRCLLALGQNKEAKDFVNSGKYKITKAIKDRVAKLDAVNVTPKIVEPIEEEDEVQENKIDFGIKRQQFSNEKLLEDELTARIEAGMEVFGMKLKMYQRRGQYGRQFIIPVGRLDLLCEDDEGNLYVIELKKDSGYDDAYKQTAAYLDWFEKSEMAQGKNVYGIICLNSPTKALIEKVHKDKRMKIFEYQISYTEL